MRVDIPLFFSVPDECISHASFFFFSSTSSSPSSSSVYYTGRSVGGYIYFHFYILSPLCFTHGELSGNGLFFPSTVLHQQALLLQHGPTATTPVVSRNRQARGHSFLPPRHLSHDGSRPISRSVHHIPNAPFSTFSSRQTRARGPPFPFRGWAGPAHASLLRQRAPRAPTARDLPR